MEKYCICDDWESWVEVTDGGNLPPWANFCPFCGYVLKEP